MTVRRVEGALSLDVPLDASVVTAGTFDGVHLGHQQLVRAAVDEARRRSLPAVAYTFDPHPAAVLSPKGAPPLLATTDERVRLLGELGIDWVIVEPFDRAFANVPADQWIERYIVGALHPQRVVVGFNFTYGKDRAGDAQQLLRAGERYGFGVDVIPAVQRGAEVVSSTRIRKLLQLGEVEAAAELLGRRPLLVGTVASGDRRGRKIGFPTANLIPSGQMLPASGVYATRVEVGDRMYEAVTNIGVRPTFGGRTLVVESHLLEFEGDLYGRSIRVEFCSRLRDERKFDSLEALLAQIAKDVEAARMLFGSGS